MSLVFSAIIPHSPLLIPNVGKENFKQVKKTKNALKILADDLYASKPDSLVIISPHAPLFKDTFLINLATKYQGDFEKFGDFETKLEFKADPELVSNIKARSQEENIPLNLICASRLDHGTTVPLFWLLEHLTNIPIIPISFSLLDLKKHFDFGILLQKEILKSTKRVAAIASGDLSHCLSPDAPAGFKKEGRIFDRSLIDLLKQKNTAGILNLDPNLIKNASECGLRSIVILLGLLNDINYKPEILAYESPFGIGYLTFEFLLT